MLIDWLLCCTFEAKNVYFNLYNVRLTHNQLCEMKSYDELKAEMVAILVEAKKERNSLHLFPNMSYAHLKTATGL